MAPRFGNAGGAEAVRQRAEASTSRLERLALLDLGARMAPLDRPLRDGEVHLRLGLAARDLASRAWSLGGGARTSVELPDASIGPARDIEALAYDISGAWISPWGAVLVEGRLFPEDFRYAPTEWRRTGWTNWTPEWVGFHGFDPDDESCVVDRGVRTLSLDGDAPHFLFDMNTGAVNFGHFIHDTLSQLLAYDAVSRKLGRRPIPLLTRSFKYPMQSFLFERLVCPLSEAVFMQGRAVEARRCYASSRALRGWEGLVSVDAFRHLRDRLRGLVPEGAGEDKVYISRGDSKVEDGRKFANLAAFEGLLRDEGFRFSLLGELSPAETVELLSRAGTIIGIHGAGLLNALLAPDGVHVIELWPHPRAWRSIAMVLAACGIRHTVVRSLVPGADGLGRIDIDRVRGAL